MSITPQRLSGKRMVGSPSHRSIEMKKNKMLQTIIAIVILLLSHVGRSIVLDDDGIKFAESIDYAGLVDGLINLLEEVDEGSIRAIEFSDDDSLLKHSDKVELMGELNFTGLKGDMIIVRKTDGKWVEIARYLKE